MTAPTVPQTQEDERFTQELADLLARFPKATIVWHLLPQTHDDEYHVEYDDEVDRLYPEVTPMP